MALTVADIEVELLILVGPFLRRVGLDGTTADGSNVALRGSIRRAVGRLGIATADSIDVADGDLLNVTRADYETLLDLAELRTLETIWGNWPEVDQSAGEESQSLSQLADRLERRIAALKQSLGTLVGDPAATALVPGPPAHGLIRAGRCVPGMTRPWNWAAWRACR